MSGPHRPQPALNSLHLPFSKVIRQGFETLEISANPQSLIAGVRLSLGSPMETCYSSGSRASHSYRRPRYEQNLLRHSRLHDD